MSRTTFAPQLIKAGDLVAGDYRQSPDGRWMALVKVAVRDTGTIKVVWPGGRVEWFRPFEIVEVLMPNA